MANWEGSESGQSAKGSEAQGQEAEAVQRSSEAQGHRTRSEEGAKEGQRGSNVDDSHVEGLEVDRADVEECWWKVEALGAMMV